MSGQTLDAYRAPLFVAWQLTNQCSAHCVACCEESGPTHAWRNELPRVAAVELARSIAKMGVPYVAFGGGEPCGVPHFWELLEVLSAGGVALKIETNGSFIDAAAAERLATYPGICVQISVDGANATTHERMRRGTQFEATLASIRHLVASGVRPQAVFVPTRLNIHEMLPTYDLARSLDCSAFVTGPLMRLGRAAAAWERIACSPEEWQRAVAALREHARDTQDTPVLSIYPWDILEELRQRLVAPQAMLLVVPDGKVKLLNALPFAAADLREHSLADAWEAYRRAWRMPQVRRFVEQCLADPGLLRHANETWPLHEELAA